jgi:hypothetical protein
LEDFERKNPELISKLTLEELEIARRDLKEQKDKMKEFLKTHENLQAELEIQKKKEKE